MILQGESRFEYWRGENSVPIEMDPGSAESLLYLGPDALSKRLNNDAFLETERSFETGSNDLHWNRVDTKIAVADSDRSSGRGLIWSWYSGQVLIAGEKTVQVLTAAVSSPNVDHARSKNALLAERYARRIGGRVITEPFMQPALSLFFTDGIQLRQEFEETAIAKFD